MKQGIIIIPAYNEGMNLLRVVEDITENAPFMDYIIINDGSTDDTGNICEENGLNALHLPINLGIGGAVQTGYRYAFEMGYEYAVQVDGDGQHKTQYLKRMLEELKISQADMIIGSRFLEKNGFQSTKLRRMGIRYFEGLIRLMTGQRVTDSTSGMRMINRKVIGWFADYYPKDYPEPETVAMVLKRGGKVFEMPVEMEERQGGKSSIGLVRSIYYMVKVSLAVVLV